MASQTPVSPKPDAFYCRAEFLKSSEKTAHLPPPDLPEFAFIGRSNVGKSSLINMITGQFRMAKVSSTPGKTQLINHFALNISHHNQPLRNCYLTDLPGYGFAKVSQKRRAGWSKMTETYLKNRSNLRNTFVLIDIRIPAQKLDLEFCTRMAENQLPFSLIFTKADKVGKTQIHRLRSDFNLKFLEIFTELPLHIVSSAESKTGRQEILEYLYDWSA
jgi:GTP-binding protein